MEVPTSPVAFFFLSLGRRAGQIFRHASLTAGETSCSPQGLHRGTYQNSEAESPRCLDSHWGRLHLPGRAGRERLPRRRGSELPVLPVPGRGGRYGRRENQMSESNLLHLHARKQAGPTHNHCAGLEKKRTAGCHVGICTPDRTMFEQRTDP